MKTHHQINTPYCNRGLRGATFTPKAKAPVCSNTLSEAVAAPTEKRGFVMLNFWGWCDCTALRFWGVVGAIRKDARTASDVLLPTTLHLLRVVALTVALVTPEGAKTMTMTTTPASLRTAYALSQAHHALARHVPDMAHGFTIQTGYGQINIPPGPTAKRITALVEKMLRAELADAAKAAQQGGAA
jgi:hypothetical protein